MWARKKLGRSKALKPYRFQWLCIIGGELQEALNYFAGRLGEETYELKKFPEAHFSAFRPHKTGLIWFKSKDLREEFIAHECFHATMYLFETLDMDGPVEKTEEVFAYYLEWLTKKIREHFP